MARCTRCLGGEATLTYQSKLTCSLCFFSLTSSLFLYEGYRQVYHPHIIRVGVGGLDLECGKCGATWQGKRDDECRWCLRYEARLLEWERFRLLWPEWVKSFSDPRYRALQEPDKAVWRQTRGLRDDETELRHWLADLKKAVEAFVITEDEADAARGRWVHALE